MKKILIIGGAVVLVTALVLGAVFGIPRIVRSSQEKDYSECVASKDYTGAAEVVEKMLEKDSESMELRERLAKSYYLSGQFSKASVSYKVLIDRNPVDVGYLSDYSDILLELGNDSEAITVIETLKELTGELPYYKKLVDLYEKSGNTEKILENLIYLISAEPGEAVWNYMASGIEKESGNDESSEKYLKAAVELEPGNRDYASEYAAKLYDRGAVEEAIGFVAGSEAREGDEVLEQIYVDYTMTHVNTILADENYVLAINYLKRTNAREKGNELDVLYQKLIEPPVSPEFSMSGGIIPLGQTVILELTHPERDVLIYYTTDGSVPTNESLLYEGPFTAIEPGDSRNVIKTVAFNEKGIFSEVATRVYEYPVEFADAALAGIVAEHFDTTVGELTYAMVETISSIQVWGDITAINKEYNQVIQFFGSDGGSFNKNGEFNNSRGDIKSLEDISKFKNLTELSVNSCSIGTLPDFSGLTKLTVVRLMDDRIRDISKLSSMVNVRELYLAGNGLTSMEALNGLDSPEVIWLGHNNISRTGDLSGMESLRELRLEANNLTSISGLSGLESIEKLSLGMNNISDVSPLAKMNGLTDLALLSNNISDISPLAGLTSLRELFINSNNITDVSALTGMKSLVFLNAGGNSISDVSPFLELTGLKSLYFKHNKVAYDTSIIAKMSWVSEKVLTDD